ncbi:MAG: hypothetical protein LJI21_02805 [Wolbachia endosymbiont of Menacanthus eurysternus]|nr:MAG: hypothetical protein LJI21_02805 [Wolbachia endosymbiont of Menacanthus eurysternus]
MRVQLNKVLIFIMLLSLVLSYSNKADLTKSELVNDVTIKNLIPTFLIEETFREINPSTIIRICITLVILVILFRSLIFLVMIFSILVMIFGNTEKATDFLKEKFAFIKIKLEQEKK